MAHILRRCEDIRAPAVDVWKVLTDIQQQAQYALSTTSVEVLTPERRFGPGFQWRETRRMLFLRDSCTFTVTDFDEQALAYGVQLDDGFNLIHYSFAVQPSGPDACRVLAAVDCRTRLQFSGSEACQPSERLACLMANQDGLLVKRLKQHVEASAASGPVEPPPLAGAVPCC